MGCDNRKPCVNVCCLGLILGVIVGAFVGVLFAFEYIPGITVGLWIAFGFAVLALILLFAGAYLSEVNPTIALARCLCRYTPCLLAGIFGTIISTVVSLSSAMLTSFKIYAAFAAISAMFFTLLITEVIGFVSCFACKAPRCSE
jgi:hypothetical protein